MGNIVVTASEGSNVSIQQVRHEFLFGTAIPNQLAENSNNPMSDADRKKFLEILDQNFNYAVHENALKWYDTEKEPGQVDYSVADRIWEICNGLDISMRGHCVFWEKEEFNAEWLKTLTPTELRAAVNRRGYGLAKHFKGRIDEFDLNNEMVHGDFFSSRLGYGVINEMAWLVKAGNPDAKLYLNDYALLDMGYNSGQFLRELDALLAAGVPIEGVGCQAHKAMRTQMGVDEVRAQRTLDRIAQRGLSIKITEALFAYDDEQMQVDELNKLFPIYFAHPNVEAIVMWGIWEPVHWQPHSAMWKTDWTPRPQALAYQELVFNKWWTSEIGSTGSGDSFETRAFYGDYEITVGNVTKKVTLSKSEGSLAVAF